jgi:uncharacterized repeat protein (TIGR02543 family)
MKNLKIDFLKVFGIIMMIMIVSFVMIGCDNPSGGGKDDDNDTPINDTPINNGDNPTDTPDDPADPVYFTVRFDSNGGSSVNPIENIEPGNTITLPSEPKRIDGYDFDGWYTDNNTFANAFTSATAVNADIIVYAKWTKIVYAIGDTGPAGGLIFYVNPTAVSDGWEYLEAAPKSAEFEAQWGRLSSVGTQTGIGTGITNTPLMVEKSPYTNYTAYQCADLVVDELFDDWFLPSKDELNLMHDNLHLYGKGEFEDDAYWTSSEDNDGDAVQKAWYHYFSNDFQNVIGKNRSQFVRAIRQF